MILPRGITGFWSANTAPSPLLDEKAFRQMCYSIALENGGTVTELDTDTQPRNFYSAQIRKHDNFILFCRTSTIHTWPLLGRTIPVDLF